VIACALAVLCLPLAACGSEDEEEGGQQTTAAQQGEQSPGDSTNAGRGGKEESGPNGSNPEGAGGGETELPAPGPESTGDPAVDEFGSEAEGSEREAIVQAARSYLRARARGDWARACRGLTTAAKQSIAGLLRASGRSNAGCPAAYEALQSSVPLPLRREAADSPVLEVRVRGDSAFYVFRTRANRVDTVLAMAREDGEWKAVTVAGAVLPRPPGS